MKHYSAAEIITSDLREAYLHAIVLLKRVSPRYKTNKRSHAYRFDVASQNFSNELRNLAAAQDEYEAARLNQPKDPAELL